MLNKKGFGVLEVFLTLISLMILGGLLNVAANTMLTTKKINTINDLSLFLDSEMALEKNYCIANPTGTRNQNREIYNSKLVPLKTTCNQMTTSLIEVTLSGTYEGFTKEFKEYLYVE